jgi:glycosyltransferase involved in cell wall biosynthesis
MGGMETYCAKLVEQLRNRRTVELLALPGAPDGSVPSPARLARFGLSTASRILFGAPLPGLIHVGDIASWPFALLARLRRPSIRLVMSAHGTDVSYGRRPGLRGKLYQAYLRLGAAMLPSAKIIANSEATAQACREPGFRNVRIVALASDMQPPETGLKPSQNLLFAGRVIRLKGLSWFVQNVLPTLPRDIVLEVAGSLWSEEEAKCLANERVNYVGVLPQRELAKAYANALCVIVPNVEMQNGEFEGFGLVAVEAASAGGVVLASDTGGLRSAVKHGVTGFLVEGGESWAWVARIVDIRSWTAKKRRDFVATCTAEVRAHFSWERVAMETEAIYAG